jgi:hypothetical protein
VHQNARVQVLTMTEKVYGMTAMHAGRQMRMIGAFRSVGAFTTAAGHSRSTYTNYGSTTGNFEETTIALAEPGVVFYRPINDRQGDPWARVVRTTPDARLDED